MAFCAEDSAEPGHPGSLPQASGRRLMLRRSKSLPPQPLTAMINVILALVPLSFATGSLVWLMTSGAQAQARSDAWAEKWVRDNV